MATSFKTLGRPAHKPTTLAGKRIDTDAEKVAAAATAMPLAANATTAELLSTLPREAALERVVSERLAAEFLSLSYSYFRELRDQGRGPDWIRLNDKRIGYRVRDLMEWCEARKRSGGIRSRLNPTVGLPLTGDGWWIGPNFARPSYSNGAEEASMTNRANEEQIAAMAARSLGISQSWLRERRVLRHRPNRGDAGPSPLRLSAQRPDRLDTAGKRSDKARAFQRLDHGQ